MNKINYLIVISALLMGSYSICKGAELETYPATEEARSVPESMPMEDTYSLDPVSSKKAPVSKIAKKELKTASKKVVAKLDRKEIETLPLEEPIRERSLSYSAARGDPKISTKSVNKRLDIRKELQAEDKIGSLIPDEIEEDSYEEDLPPPPVLKAAVETPAPVEINHTQVKKSRSPFEPVPSDQVDSVANRLSVVEQILRKYGRAYDYRAMTTSELLRVYRDLGSEGSSETLIN